MMRVIRFCQILIAALIISGAATAQGDNLIFDSGEKDCERGFCFKSRPYPKCRTSIITESGFTFNLDVKPSGMPYLDQAMVSNFMEIGFVRNCNRAYGFGCTAYVGYDQNRLTYGIKPRYRRWLGQHFCLDLSPGLILVQDDIGENYKGHGFMGSATFGIPQSISLTLRLMTVKVPIAESQSKYDTSVSCGVLLGSTPGLVGVICYTGILLTRLVACHLA